MARFWDARAREDALYFIDNTLAYKGADRSRFWQRGEEELNSLLGAVRATLNPDDDVLEIGCGIGRMTRAVSRRVRHVTALDVSTEMLARAKESNTELTNVAWLRGDGTSLRGVADSSVDACVSHVVFQHIPDPEITLGYIREMGRVLRPGGWSAFQISDDPAIHRWRWDSNQWKVRISSLFGRAPRQQSHPAWRGSRVELGRVRTCAREGGMDVERVAGEGTQLCFVLARARAGAAE